MTGKPAVASHPSSRHAAGMRLPLLLLVASAVGAAEPTFATHIQPLLTERCSKCHGAEKQKGELRLDSLEAVLKGGENGAVVVAGKPEASPMIELISKPKSDADRMPPKGEPLAAEQVDLLRRWIAAGAK